MAFLRALSAGLLALIIAVAGACLIAPAAVADPTGQLQIGPAEQEEALSVSAFQYAGVELSGSGLPNGSVDLWLDRARTSESFDVVGGSLRGRFVAFPDITVGLHTFTLQQGTTVVATRTVNVLANPRFTFGISKPWISADTLQDTGLVLDVSGLASNALVTASIGTTADPYELTVDSEADDDGMVTITLRNTAVLASLRKAGVVAAGITTRSGPQQTTFVPIHITEPAVTTQDNGSRIVGTGFQPDDEVTWSYIGVVGSSGTATGSARADAAGSLVFDSPFTGRADVTLSGTVGSITARGLTLLRRVPETFTPTETTVIKDSAAVAGRLDVEADSVLDLLGPLLSSGQTDRRVDRELLSLQRQQAQDELALLASIRDGAPQTRPEPATLPVQAGGLASVNGLKLEASRANELKTASRDVGSKLDRLAPQDKGTAVERDLTQVASTIDELLASADATRERATILSSDPELVGVGVLPPSGIVSVPIPADFTGLHHIGLVDTQSGYFTAWQPIMVSPPVEAPPVVVPPAPRADAPSTTLLQRSGSRQVKGESILLRATVSSAVRPRGIVELVVDGKVVARRTIDTRTGTRALRLPSRTAAGVARVQIRYRGTAGVAPSTSKVIRIRVAR